MRKHYLVLVSLVIVILLSANVYQASAGSITEHSPNTKTKNSVSILNLNNKTLSSRNGNITYNSNFEKSSPFSYVLDSNKAGVTDYSLPAIQGQGTDKTIEMTNSHRNTDGIILYNSPYLGGPLTISFTGYVTNLSYLPADGYEIYMFVNPLNWNTSYQYNWSVPYYSSDPVYCTDFSPIQGNLMLPFSTTPYIMIQWDPYWDDSTEFNLWLVQPGPNGIDNILIDNGIGNGGFVPSNGNSFYVMATYNSSSGLLSAFVEDTSTGLVATLSQNISTSFPEPIFGNYVFGIGADTGDSWGTWYVNSASIFTGIVHKVIFTETGLPSDQQWSVNIGNITNTSTSQNISFLESAGNYEYSIISPVGYLASPQNGTIEVATSDITQEIKFVAHPTIKIFSKFSGFFITNYSLENTFGIFSAWGDTYPTHVNVSLDGKNYSLNSSNGVLSGPYNLTVNMGTLSPGSMLKAVAEYSNGTSLTAEYPIFMVWSPPWLMDFLEQEINLHITENITGEWNNSYLLSLSHSFGLSSLFNLTVPLPQFAAGGNFSLIPSVKLGISLSSTGTVTLSGSFKLANNGIPIGPASFSVKIVISAVGVLQISGDGIKWVSAIISVNVGGSVSLTVPVAGYTFNVPIIGNITVGLTATFTVSPDVAVNILLMPTNNTTQETFPGLGIMIKNITGKLSTALTASLNAGIGIASITGSGTLKFVMYLEDTRPYDGGGKITGTLAVSINSLIWSGTIWSDSGTLYSWNNIPSSSFQSRVDPTSMIEIGRYYNTSNYNQIIWKNASWNGTAIQDIYPYTTITSGSYGNSSILFYESDNISASEARSLTINSISLNTNNRSLVRIPMPKVSNEIMIDPTATDLSNGSIMLLWDALPFKDMDVSGPMDIHNTTLQASFYNGTWSNVENITNSGISESFRVAQNSTGTFILDLINSRILDPNEKLYIFGPGDSYRYIGNVTNISELTSFDLNAHIATARLVNGSHVLIDLSNRQESHFPYYPGKSVIHVSPVINDSSDLTLLYSGSSNYTVVVYNLDSGNVLFEDNISSNTSMVYAALVNGNYFIIAFSPDYISVYEVVSGNMVIYSHYQYTNITLESVAVASSDIVIFTAENYGNISEPLLNLSISVVPLTPPPVPELNAISYNNDTVFLEWQEQNSLQFGVSGYQIYESFNSGPYTQIVTVNSSYSQYVIPIDSSGSYSFVIRAINPVGSSQYSNVYSIDFYSVTFTQLGLPTNQEHLSWGIILLGKQNMTTNQVISFILLNGTYNFTIIDAYGYLASSSGGQFTVNGRNITIDIKFSLVTYTVTFTESGLQSGTSWSVTLNGTTESSTTDTITFSVPNGTYSYTIATVNNNYSPNPSSGTFTVNGSNVNVAITFNLVTYKVTFTENGLPSGTTWYVNLSNGQSYSGTGTTITFNAPNGTYSYTIATVNKNYYAPSPSSGSFAVNGANVNMTITFTLVTYKITFTENGLPSGTSWSVIMNNITKTSTNGTIIFNEPNGTYTYSIRGISGYRANAYSGTINVNGNPVINSITWSMITYTITITENGIPNGTSWSATLTGTTFNGQYINVTLISNTNTITFNEPNGSYSYTIHLPSGYQSSNAKGSINVSGNSETLTFSAQKTMNYLSFEIIAAIVIIAIIIGIIFLRMVRKK